MSLYAVLFATTRPTAEELNHGHLPTVNKPNICVVAQDGQIVYRKLMKIVLQEYNQGALFVRGIIRYAGMTCTVEGTAKHTSFPARFDLCTDPRKVIFNGQRHDSEST